jgi:hypothetical protein
MDSPSLEEKYEYGIKMAQDMGITSTAKEK